MARVSFGDADFLSFPESGIEAEALFHARQYDVGGGIQNAMEASQVNGGQIVAEQREDGHAVHDGRLKKETPFLRSRQLPQLVVRINDRSLIRCDGMGSVLECSANMIDGGLSA